MVEVLNDLVPNQRFWIVIRFAILISLIETFTQFTIKKRNIISGILGYSLIVLILYNAYNYEGLGHMNLVWSCVSIITCYIVGCVYLNEPFNKYTVGAIFFALCAIYLAHRADEIG